MLVRQGARIKTKRAPRIVEVPFLSARTISDTEIELLWDFIDLHDIIEIERSADGVSGWAQIAAPFGSTGGTYTNGSLTPGEDYFYRARGIIIAPETLTSEYSDVVSDTTTDTSPTLTAPVNLEFAEASRTAASVTNNVGWDAVTNADTYDYWFVALSPGAYSAGSSGSPLNTALTTVPVVMSRLEDDSTTQLHVRARNDVQAGPEASPLAIDIPGNLKASNVAATVVGVDVHITVVEDAESDAADAIELEHSINASAFANIDETIPDQTAPQFIHVDPGFGTHRYQVRSRDDDTVDRFSGYSNIAQAVIGSPPSSGADGGMDFSTEIDSLSQLPSNIQVINAGNILYDDGSFIMQHTGQPSGVRGILYRYIEKNQPAYTLGQICTDQSLTVMCIIPNTLELFIEYKNRWSSNYTNIHPDCSGGTDYKCILPYLNDNSNRGDWKVGAGGQGNTTTMTGLGGVALATGIPPAVWQRSSPVSALSLFNGLDTTHQLHWQLIFNPGAVGGPRWEEVMQAKINGQLQHSYRGKTNFDLGTRTWRRFKMGANRNRAAYEEMYMHARSVHWWTSSNPGWFDGVPIADWANAGGATYIP